MIVKVYASDSATFLRHSDLQDLFPNDRSGAQEQAAASEIQRTGRVWIGGGDEPLFYVTKA